MRLAFRPQARAEMLEAKAWYEERSSGLGSAFAATADAVAGSIERMPLRFPKVHGEMRKAVFPRFPYSFLFQIVDEDILVLACFHHRRDPSDWADLEVV